MRAFRVAALLGLVSPLLLGGAPAETPANLILFDGAVWTVDPAQPQAQAIAIRADRIVRVGSDREALALKGPKTQVIDLDGKLVLPGFIDAHTHLGNAVDAFFELRLNGVDDEATLLSLIRDRAARVPARYWITGGDWSAQAGWKLERAGDVVLAPLQAPRRKNGQEISFAPSLEAVDALTPDQPVLLKRYDGAYFINSMGLKLLHIDKHSPDPAGGRYERHPASGELTGMLYGTAGERALRSLPPRSRAQRLLGATAMVRQLNSHGITGIHDIARVPEVAEKLTFSTDVERSATDFDIFTDLRSAGALTVRVNPILTLKTWESLPAAGINPMGGDDLIRFGALKMFVDGFLMMRPYKDNPRYAGSLSFRNRSVEELRAEVLAADRAGWDIATHVTGDKAHLMAFDWYEEAVARNSPRDRRFRILHAWYPREQEIGRGGRMGVIGDITPYHLIREIPSLERKLHDDQLGSAFAWRSMIRAGWRLNIVSDWPGSYDGNHDAPVNPLENIYLAITRSDFPDAATPVAWRPEQALTIEEAIAAYTINPAWSSREQAVRGSITPGKLADLVVLSRDIRKLAPRELLATRTLYTILGGRIVFTAPSLPATDDRPRGSAPSPSESAGASADRGWRAGWARPAPAGRSR